jgi:hypothetical protein
MTGQRGTRHQATGRLGHTGRMGHPGSASAPFRVVRAMIGVGFPPYARKSGTQSAPAAPPLSGSVRLGHRG